MLHSEMGEIFTKLLQIQSKRGRWEIEIVVQTVIMYAFLEETATF